MIASRFRSTIDVTAAAEEASRGGEWALHFNTQIYQGDWSGIPLRAAKGSLTALYPDPAADEYIDTPEIADYPSIKEILKKFECEKESVRLMRLDAGAEIREHRDYKLSLEDGVARIHIPLRTNSDVEFRVAGKLIPMAAGEIWYLNLNNQHSVRNPGQTTRIHLVIDCITNDWLKNEVALGEIVS